MQVACTLAESSATINLGNQRGQLLLSPGGERGLPDASQLSH